MIKDRQPAPDAVVVLWDGTQQPLRRFWKEKKTVLVFLRHLGWLFCREQVVQLHRNKNRFDEAGVQIVLVSMGSVEESAAFRLKMDISFPMVSDPDRSLFHRYKIVSMSISSMFTPKLMMRTASALAKGHGIGFPYGDVRQLSAVFVIETDGTVSYRHYAKDAADHPQPEQILAIL